ncbi:MAG: tetratricopeptide repeat protein [Nitrospinae bacterium]|nr:tetratricopeptide repeat protein [Nitrospinota bacterium]
MLLYPATQEVRDAKFQIAEAYYLRGQYEQALKVFEGADKRWPSFIKQNPQTFYRYADTNYRLEKRDKARGLFAELANLYPANAHGLNAVNKLADIYLADGKTAVAVKLLNIQARAWPDQPAGVESRLRLAALGQAEHKVITPAEATLTPYPDYFDPLAAYNDVIKKHPDWDYAQEAMFQKAKLYHRNKRHIESIVTLQGFMRTYPALAATPPVVDLVKENLFEMVNNFHRQDGNFAVLYTYYGNFDPFFADVKDTEILMNVADAYYGMGLYGRSYEKYRRAEELLKGERLPRIAFGKGRALAAIDDGAGAAAELAPFMNGYAKSAYAPYALQILGDIYAQREDRPRAIAAYRAGLDVSAGKGLLASYTAYRAGIASKQEKNFSGAIKYFKAAIERYQPYLDRVDGFYQKDSHFQMMEAAYRGGLYRDAIDYSEEAVAKYPDAKMGGWVRFVKSDSEAKLSEDEKALDGLREIVKDEPSSVFGKVADATLNNAGWKTKNRNLFPY